MNYIPNIAQTNRQASAVAFLESMQSKIELLMKAGDAADYKARPKGGSKIVKCPKEEKRFLALAMKRRAEGMPWTQAAEGTPWNGVTLRALAIRRGLAKPSGQTRLRREHHKRIDAIAKRVNAEAKRLGSLQKALANHPEITENQYQAARERLSLPYITNQRRGSRR